MSDRKNFRIVIDTYNFFYRNVNKMESSIVKMHPNRIKVIENFISTFKTIIKSELIQKDILEQFVEWSFNYWLSNNNKSSYGTKGIQIEWIISKASIERWQKTNPKIINYELNKNIRKRVNYENKTKYKENWDKILTADNPLEEQEKEKYFNTSKGFANCFIFTTFYNHKSKNCLKCKFSEKCKEALKENLPIIYKKRGYG